MIETLDSTKRFKVRSYHLLVAACLIVWTFQKTFPSLTDAVSVSSESFKGEPWRVVTAMFAHSPYPLHIVLNMVSLWYVGKVVETRYPWWWFFSTYMVGGLVGNLTWVLLGITEPVVGASGAIFAILGMALPLTRFHWSTLLLAAINIGLGFALPHVAWQVHLGGFFVGLLLGGAFARYIVKANKRVMSPESPS